MSENLTPDSVPTAGRPDGTTGNSENVADLRREVERLRAQLAKVTTEAEMYRQAAYAALDRLHPYVPPTDEELHDLMHGPRGGPLLEVIEEYEKKYLGGS